MTESLPGRNGILVVRLWIEADHEQSLRARITRSFDPGGVERAVAVTGSVDEICDIVKRWVEDFADPPRR